MTKERLCDTDTRRASSSRGAVESVIDISKGDNQTTWEESVERSLHRVSRWESPTKQEEAAIQKKQA
jgi:hypothetical protein